MFTFAIAVLYVALSLLPSPSLITIKYHHYATGDSKIEIQTAFLENLYNKVLSKS